VGVVNLRRRVLVLIPFFFSDPATTETVVIGLLERLWHLAAEDAIRGDVGRFDDDTIAEACGWYLHSGVLIGSLLKCGWLDEHPEHRLLVHDWDDHAPRYVKGNAAKAGGIFANYGCPNGDSLREPPQGPGLKGAAPEDGSPNLTKPNLTKPNHTLSPLEPQITEVLQAWNAAPGVCKVRKLDSKRKKHLEARLKEPAWPWWEALAKFPLLCFGQSDGWKPDFDWFVRPDTCDRILEGKYDWSKKTGDHSSVLDSDELQRRSAELLEQRKREREALK